MADLPDKNISIGFKRAMRFSVFTNLRGLDDVRVSTVRAQVVCYSALPSGFFRVAGLYRELMRYDYAVVNCAPRDLLLLALLKWLNPFNRCRVVSLDTVLPVPRTNTPLDLLRHFLKVVLFKRIHLFIEYFRDTRGYQRHYRIAGRKFRYVPFKINRYEKVMSTPVRDDGYIFCGGNTRRDFATLIEAVRGTDYPVRIVTMDNAIIHGHGSSLDERRVPENVQIVRHDGSDTFIDHIAGARLVVLPIKKENISASGIGVYLASMALGKCVVISSGPAVDGVIPEGSAIVVPPEDVAALRAAIERAYSDKSYRAGFAANGQRYAMSLKGEGRLCESVMNVLVDDYVSCADSFRGKRRKSTAC